MARASHDAGLLQAALVGYQVEREKIDAKILELQAQLTGKKAPASVAKTGKVRAKREKRAAARRRIAAAQKKRWAKFHRERAAASHA